MRKEILAENVHLYLGDCREVIPTLKGVDALVSDPPYGIEDLVGGSYGRPDAKTGKRHLIANDKNLDVVAEAMTLVRKQIRSAWVVVFYSPRIKSTFFNMMESTGYRDDDYFGEMIWDKRTPGMGGQIRYQHENIAFYRLGRVPDLYDTMSVTSFASLKGDAKHGGNQHPHEKPDQVMDNIVRAVPSKLILDCFMGTGSTGAAAVRAKRGFIGVEFEPKHFEVALRKVRAAIEQPVAFWE